MTVSASGKAKEPLSSTHTGVGVASSTSNVPSDCSRTIVLVNVPTPTVATDMVASPTITKSK